MREDGGSLRPEDSSLGGWVRSQLASPDLFFQPLRKMAWFNLLRVFNSVNHFLNTIVLKKEKEKEKDVCLASKLVHCAQSRDLKMGSEWEVRKRVGLLGLCDLPGPSHSC